MDNKKIGKLIANLRNKQGLTQQELGDKVGVGFRAVSKWERGITLPDISNMNELSKILGISLDELLAGEIKKETENNNKKKIPTSIKITISIITVIILIVSSVFVYYNNKTYIYNVNSITEDCKVEGQVIFEKNDISITINRIYFKDNEFSSTIIKNYEYDIYTKDKYIFGYGYTINGNHIEDKRSIKKFAENFRINYIGETNVKMEEIVENNLTIIINFLDETNNEITKEIEISLIKVNDRKL